jgi:hypothetical protein
VREEAFSSEAPAMNAHSAQILATLVWLS